VQVRQFSHRPFSHRDAGSPEGAWLACIEELATVDLRAVRPPVVVLAPHPDDEVLAAGGLLHLLVRRGVAAHIVGVTDGEAAEPGRVDLGAVRRHELGEALARLGVADLPVTRLGLPDGRLSVLDRDRLAATVHLAVGDVGTLVAPWVHDGHPDHEAVGRVAERVAGETGADLWQYAVWAWHWAAPRDLPFDRAVRVDLDRELVERKRRAIDAFTSQVGGHDPVLPPGVRAHFERGCEVFFT
jgi:LmbE family N-acetylglucosaminyl deacetylase